MLLEFVIMALPTLDLKTSNAATGNSSSQSFNHTISGSNRYLLVACSYRTNTPHVTGITWNTTENLSLIAGPIVPSSPAIAIELWGLVNPSTGTHAVAVSWSGNTTRRMTCAASFNNVHQTTPLGTAANNNGNSLTPNVAVSAGLGDLVVDALSWNAGIAASATADSSQSQIESTTTAAGSSDNGVGMSSEAEIAAGPANVSMDWTLSGVTATGWAIIGVPLKPITSSTPPSQQTRRRLKPKRKYY